MKNLFKTLGFILLALISRSLYLHKDFYARIWDENQIAIVFVGLIFSLLIVSIIRFEKFENISED